MTRIKSYQIRIDEGVKKKLDSLRFHGDRKYSYNSMIHLILDDHIKNERYRLASDLISSIDSYSFRWENACNKINEYNERVRQRKMSTK
jgi:hypothetical protein